MNDFLKKMFIDEAKPALDRHSGSGSSGGGGIVEVDALPSPTIPDPKSIGPVPNTGYVGTVCFNTSLTNDEVKAELEKLTYIVTDESTGAEMSSLLTAANGDGGGLMLLVMRLGTEYIIAGMDMTNQAQILIWATDALGAGFGFSGWHSDFNGVLEVNCTAISEGGIVNPTAPNGVDNDKITNLLYTATMIPNPDFDPESVYRLNKYGEKIEIINKPIPIEEGSYISTMVFAEGSKFDEEAFNLVDSLIMGDENNKVYLAYQDESTNLYIATYWGSAMGWNYCLYKNGELAAMLWEFSKNNDGTRTMVSTGSSLGSTTSPTEAPLAMTQSAAPEGIVVGEYNEQLASLFYVTESVLIENAIIDQEYWMCLDDEFVEIDEKIIPSNYSKFNNKKFGFYYGQTFTIDDPISIDVPVVAEYLFASSGAGNVWYVFDTNDVGLRVPIYDMTNKCLKRDYLTIWFSKITNDVENLDIHFRDNLSTHDIDHTQTIRADKSITFTLREIYNDIYGKALVDRFPTLYGTVEWCENMNLTETSSSSSTDLNNEFNSVYRCLKIGK